MQKREWEMFPPGRNNAAMPDNATQIIIFFFNSKMVTNGVIEEDFACASIAL
jgi:hypothetical protein